MISFPKDLHASSSILRKLPGLVKFRQNLTVEHLLLFLISPQRRKERKEEDNFNHQNTKNLK